MWFRRFVRTVFTGNVEAFVGGLRGPAVAAVHEFVQETHVKKRARQQQEVLGSLEDLLDPVESAPSHADEEEVDADEPAPAEEGDAL